MCSRLLDEPKVGHKVILESKGKATPLLSLNQEE